MMTSFEPRIGDIWLTYLYFPDHPTIGKVRPIVILHVNETELTVAKITSQNLVTNGVPCVAIDRWKDAGLRRRSWIRAEPLFVIERDELLRERPLGVLDRDTLRKLFVKIHMMQK